MANIAVNKEQFDSISNEEKEKIKKGLVDIGSLREEDEIVGDSSVATFDENTQLEPLFNPIKDICKAACDVAAASAGAWCTANTAGAGLAVCLAAAESARRECRNRC